MTGTKKNKSSIPLPLEKDIQKGILEYLNMQGHFAFRVNTQGVPVWGDKKEFSHFRKAPQAGISDILGISKKGVMLAIEVKRPGNKATPDQQDFLDSVGIRGGLAIVATSIDDVIKHGL